MDNNTLYVQFLGSFSVRWNGAEIFSDVKTGGTQMLCFLQMLLLDPEQGVARGQLVEELFYDRNLRNVTHSLNVLLYNLRQRLKAFDLPDCDYIEQRDGRYYWTAKIPVIRDTEAFERLCRAAKACEDPEEGCRARLTACYQYTGEFLPMRTDSLWASHEARHYRELFHDCVIGAAAFLKKEKKFDTLKALAKHAAQVQPFCHWETLEIEALIGLKRSAEADLLYRETERVYREELSVLPGRHMIELRNQIELLRPAPTDLDSFRKKLTEKPVFAYGALICSYDGFESICRMVQRTSKAEGFPAFLMLCTLTESGVQTRENDAGQQWLREEVEMMLRSCLRATDVLCRYGSRQYLALLTEDEKECTKLQTQLRTALAERNPRIDIRFDRQPL